MEQYLNNRIEVIYAHYDPRINLQKKIIPELYYVGTKSKLNIDITPVNGKMFNNLGGLDFLKNAFSCIQISYTENKNMYYHFCGTGKIPTSFATDSVFICNRMPLHEEVLGKDYEFFMEKKKDLVKVFNKAKDCILNKEKYNNYLKKYSYIKDNFSIDSAIKNYVKLIDSIK